MKCSGRPWNALRWLLIVLLSIALNTAAIAQVKDTATLAHAFSKGKVHGHFRNVFMMTNNTPGLSDYQADAVGGHLLYQTAGFKGFSLAVGTHFTFPVFSSDLSIPDAATGVMNRYESTLFDVTQPSERRNLAMLSVLNLAYEFKKGRITLGRQLLNTPFINTQDNRMQPTAVEGLYMNFRPGKWSLETGWLVGIAPRGTLHWYSVAGSLGRYPQGINSNGSQGNYLGNVASKGIGLLALHWEPGENLHLQVWEQYADNLFNTVLLQGDYKVPAGASSKWLMSLQYIRQDIVNDGGHIEPGKTYFSKGDQVNIIGVRTGWEHKRGRILLNYTRIAAGGRFTMPREWGTEPLFTFLNRERNEGAGDIQAASVSARWSFWKQRFTTELGYGRYYMPDVKQYGLNKYSMPAYTHSKLAMDYVCGGALNNMKLSVLNIYKRNNGATYNNLRYVINKVDVSHLAIVVNYPF